jgi:lysophospholipase L1-like esterase
VTIASLTSPKTLRRTQLTGLANTTHTIVFTGQSAPIAMLIFGIATYKSRTTGLRFAWTAKYGTPLSGFTLGTTPDYGQDQIWQGRSGATLTGFGFPAQPDLAIIGLGINDCRNIGSGYALEGYQAGLRMICQAVRRGNANASILFVAFSNPDGDNSDVTSPFANSIQWPLYIDRMLNIAIDYNAAMVNLHAKWGELGVASGYQVATDPHPTDAGHADIASVLGAIL